jgi:hypothetical protein
MVKEVINMKVGGREEGPNLELKGYHCCRGGGAGEWLVPY